MEQHSILAIFKAKPGKSEELKKVLQALIVPTLQEEGCINYDLHQSVTNSAEFMFYEKWKNLTAFSKHCTAPHIVKWREIKAQLIESSHVTEWTVVE